MVTVGADRYPLPGFVTVIYFMVPFVPSVAFATAPLPPPPTNLTKGVSKYCVPPFLMFTLNTSNPTLSAQYLLG